MFSKTYCFSYTNQKDMTKILNVVEGLKISKSIMQPKISEKFTSRAAFVDYFTKKKLLLRILWCQLFIFGSYLFL